MDITEKKIKLDALEIALEDLNKIIDTMEEKGYAKEDLNEYYKKRWNVWNEIYQVKKQ